MPILKRGLDFLRTAYTSGRRYMGYVVFELPLGLETSAKARLRELGFDETERVQYEPSPWLVLRRALPKSSVSPHDVFLDFGSGKGAIVLQAAQYPFRKVIGVELTPQLHAIARENLARALPTLRCKDVELVNSDALNYRVPDDVTVVYFYNPFFGGVFAKVVDELKASLARRPRTLRIIYLYPAEEATLIAAGARVTKVSRRLRPGRAWMLSATVKVFELGPDVADAADAAMRDSGRA